MSFEEWYAAEGQLMAEAGCSPEVVARAAYFVATNNEREACALAAEGFSEKRDDRQWVPGSLYDALRRETAAAIRKRSKA